MPKTIRLGRWAVTFYPRHSAMHGAVDIRTPRWGYICVRPPIRSFGRWFRPYLYVSPDATPNRMTFGWYPWRHL